MRVKRLEIQGFKSFKDKTVIHFDHGITGIVGPNGCGKSNIVDAFFWVMGEQSYKHMRGASSDDLIFNGSSKYNPLGMAEATLVMETDAVDTANAPAGASAFDTPVHIRSKEVSVTRRLYRSGEGEYFVNGTPARLKDIHELFMDTGVGAKGYSVIEQGQIGKIVNSKPEERRLLIEEAAGIAKYKARKKESLRKMEATQGNLSRLNDVIQEIERSLNSLERQAQKARLYRKYKDELLDKEMTWGRRKNQVLRQKLEALRKDRDALEQELVGLRAELQVAENAIETDRVDQVTDTKLAEELQSQIAKLSDELSQERSALELSRRRQGDLSSQIASLESERTELTASISAEKERLTVRQTEAGQAQEQFASAALEAQAQDESTRAARTETETKRRELENIKRELMRGITQASDLTSRAASLLSRMESAVAQAERLEQQAQSQTEKVAAAREESEKASSAATSARTRREELQVERKAQSAQVQASEQKARALDRETQDASKALTQLRSRLTSLEELAASHEGMGDGPKAALDWAKQDHRALSALADHLDVKPGYEAALEGWLEKRLENLVAGDAASAFEALAHLKGEKLGRVGIHLFASQGAGDSSGRKKLEDAGFKVEGMLADFVVAKNEIAAVAISGVFLVESLSSTSLESLASLGLNLVSRDGIALDHAGVLRGGSEESGGASGILRRKQVIAGLQAQVAQSDSEFQAKEAASAAAKQ
ncbi:MAG: chromosome segregation SMC family protein, partial [Bdellovibrionota bacterium]